MPGWPKGGTLGPPNAAWCEATHDGEADRRGASVRRKPRVRSEECPGVPSEES